MGPHCHDAQSTPSFLLQACELACTVLWSENNDNYKACSDPMKCFSEDFSEPTKLVAALGKDFDPLVAQDLSSSCSFGNSVDPSL